MQEGYYCCDLKAVVVEIVRVQAQWEEALCEPLAQAAQEAYVLAKPDGDKATIGLRLTDDKEMTALNHKWRGKNKPTNVLAFPAETKEMLGDVVLGRETIVREAEAAQKPVLDHLRHLVVHGVLHLLGYDHKTEEQARVMETLEVQVLGRLGLASPYPHLAGEAL